jgi:putative sigma-54 modulation protein
MKFSISAKKFKLTKSNEDYIQKKMRQYLKLGQSIRKITYKFKVHTAQKNYPSKYVGELKIDIPKASFILKEISEDFYNMVDQLSDKAEREIRKHKEKQRSLRRKGFLLGKELLRSVFKKLKR